MLSTRGCSHMSTGRDIYMMVVGTGTGCHSTQVDPKGDRTVGVLTKIDLMDPGESGNCSSSRMMLGVGYARDHHVESRGGPPAPPW